MPVNLLVILDIVFMIARSGKNGVQIERGGAQFLNVVQSLHNPLQVAAEKLNTARLAMWARSFSPGTGNHWPSIAEIFTAAYIIGRVTIGEALGENLVEDAIVYPIRGLVVRQDVEIAGIRRRVPHHPCCREPPGVLGREQVEAVPVV